MKGKRTGSEINDFSGGQVTKAPLIGINTKFTPDCLNVYAEGKALRKRLGISALNSSAITGNPNGNGIYNWVKSASNQLLMAVFGTTLYNMNNSNGWDGTLNSISFDTVNGAAFSNSIRHLVTYNGTLIMTSENRDKPQYMSVTDVSHFNLNYLGAGTVPNGKYPQVWKGHVWILNIGQGGTFTEDCDSITAWTNSDVGTGSSTQTTFSGSSAFRFLGGTNSGDNAKETRTISGGFPDDYTIEMRAYYNTLTTVATGNYASANFLNGVINLQTRFYANGIDVNDGTNWNQVGVSLVNQATWSIWKFIVTGGTTSGARVDVLKDGTYVGLQFPCMAASTASDGQINLSALAATATSRADWYLDYLYISASNAVVDRIANGSFEAWGGGLPTSWNVYPTQAKHHLRMNDNAASSTVTDSGSTATNDALMNSAEAAVNSNVVTDAAGKISRAFTFTSASGHHINISTAVIANISANTVGTFVVWTKPTTNTGNIFTLSAVGSATLFELIIDGNTNFHINVANAGSTKLEFTAGAAVTTTGLWTHFAMAQNGTAGPIVYINGATVALAYLTTTNKDAWLANLGTIDNFKINARKYNGGAVDRFLSGSFDDFRYYSTALSSVEILSIYAEGNGNEGVSAVVQETTTTKIGSNALKITSTGEYGITVQSLSTGSALAGLSSVVGLWANVTNNATYKIRVAAGTNNADSAVLTGNGTWQYQTLSFTPPSSTTSVDVQVISTSSSTVILDYVSAIATSTGIVTDNSDRLQRTAVNTYNNWSGTDSGYNDITTPGDVGLTGSAILFDRLYIFKKFSIHRVTYTGSLPLLDIKQAKATIGTASPRSIKNIDIPNRGEVIIFLGTDRQIYLFDGYQTTPISDNISVTNGLSNVYMNNINAQALNTVHAVIHSQLKWYELFVPMGGSTQPNYSIIVDFSGQEPVFWPNDNRNFLSSAISDNGLGQRVVYVLNNTNGTIYLTNNSNSDAGTAINGYWTSFKVGSPVMLNRIDEIEVQTDNVVCTPTFQWRMDWETTWVSKTLNVSSYSNNFNPGRIDNFAQFQLVDNSTTAAFKLWSIGMYERPLGMGK